MKVHTWFLSPLPAVLVLSMAAASCDQGRESQVAPPVASVQETSNPLDNFPVADTAEAIPESISPIAAEIDRNLGSARVETATLDPERPGWEPRVIRGWYLDGVLRRLSVTEPTDAGRMSGETVFYIEAGEPRVVRRPEALILLRPDGTLERWLDPTGEEVEVSVTQSNEQIRELRGAFRRWQSALLDSSAVPEVINDTREGSPPPGAINDAPSSSRPR